MEYGVDAVISDLRSERDRNFLAVARDGRRLVVKVSNSGDDPDQIAMESAAMHHVEEVDPDLPIPRVLTSLDGRSMVTVEAADGRTHLVRVMTVMPGDVADLTALPRPQISESVGGGGRSPGDRVGCLSWACRWGRLGRRGGFGVACLGSAVCG